MYDDFFARADELRSAGTPFATAVVVWAERPTSGKPGDRAIVTADGTMSGWIGGSCAQPTIVREAVRALADGTARLVRLSPEPGAGGGRPGVVDVLMTCYGGGTLEIFVEPHQPAPRLLIVGKLPVARALAHLGKALGYRVISIDPEAGDAMTHADEQLTDLADVASMVTPLTFAVVATHGEYDESALEALLETGAPYVGLVASRSRGATVIDALRAAGVSAERLERVRFPAGLDIGARRGDEIAVSIIAEIVQTLRGLGEIEWEEVTRGEPAVGGDGDRDGDRRAAPEPVVDPVCGMTVDPSRDPPTSDHEGRTYYFCCAGCAARFESDPEPFLAESGV
ncbi:MAG: XdhC family protein [Gemmatimonadota bacterium]|nr:XdhC family protein [Gemmatimonadota bacterium]